MNHETAVSMVHCGLLVLVDQIDDGRGFASAGRAVKQQVGEMPSFDDVAHHELVQRVQHNVVKIRWPIFFNPRGRTRTGAPRSGHSNVCDVIKYLNI